MRRLTPAEVAAYDMVPPELVSRVWVQKVPILAPGVRGMTIGRLVLLRSDDDRSGRRMLLAHELVHVVQYEHLGVARFLWRYVSEYARNLWRLRSHRQAYLSISLEVDARAVSALWAIERPGVEGNWSR